MAGTTLWFTSLDEVLRSVESQFLACFEPLLKGEQVSEMSLHRELRYHPRDGLQIVNDCSHVSEEQAALPLFDCLYGQTDLPLLELARIFQAWHPGMRARRQRWPPDPKSTSVHLLCQESPAHRENAGNFAGIERRMPNED